METLIDQLDAEMERWRQHDADSYRQMIERSHEPATADATILVDLIRRGHVTHDQAKADISAHLEEHRRQQEAEAAEQRRKAERAERLRPLLAEWSALASDVTRLETFRPFIGARDELHAAAEAAVVLGLPLFNEDIEPAESMLPQVDRGRAAGRFLRSRSWNEIYGIPNTKWQRPDGVGGLFIEQAVARCLDDDLAPLVDRLRDFLQPQAPLSQADLPDDTEAAVAQATTNVEKLRERMATLAEPSEDVVTLLMTAAAALAHRRPGEFGDLFLELAGHSEEKPAHWRNPHGGISIRKEALAGELRQRVRPIRGQIVKALAKFDPFMQPAAAAVG